jgi:hypothetical protein
LGAAVVWLAWLWDVPGGPLSRPSDLQFALSFFHHESKKANTDNARDAGSPSHTDVGAPVAAMREEVP